MHCVATGGIRFTLATRRSGCGRSTRNWRRPAGHGWLRSTWRPAGTSATCRLTREGVMPDEEEEEMTRSVKDTHCWFCNATPVVTTTPPLLCAKCSEDASERMREFLRSYRAGKAQETEGR